MTQKKKAASTAAILFCVSSYEHGSLVTAGHIRIMNKKYVSNNRENVMLNAGGYFLTVQCLMLLALLFIICLYY